VLRAVLERPFEVGAVPFSTARTRVRPFVVRLIVRQLPEKEAPRLRGLRLRALPVTVLRGWPLQVDAQLRDARGLVGSRHGGAAYSDFSPRKP
jgi:hypothetical protein